MNRPTHTITAASARYRDRLRDILGVSPANLVARLGLVDAFVRAGESDSAVRHLVEVRRTPPEPTPEARARIDSTIQLLRAGNLPASRQALDRLLQTMALTSPYQASVEEVTPAFANICVISLMAARSSSRLVVPKAGIVFS